MGAMPAMQAPDPGLGMGAEAEGGIDPSALMRLMGQAPPALRAPGAMQTPSMIQPQQQQQKPPFMDRLTAGLFPGGPMGDFLDPKQLHDLRKQQMIRMGLNLLANSGPKPQGTSDPISSTAQSISQSVGGFPDTVNEAAGHAMQLYQFQQMVDGRKQMQDVIQANPMPEGATTAQKRDWWGRVSTQLAATGNPVALQFLEHVGPTMKDVLGPDLQQQLEIQKYTDAQAARKQAYDLGQKEGWIGKGEQFQAGRDYVKDRDEWQKEARTETMTERKTPGHEIVRVYRNKLGETREEKTGEYQPPPPEVSNAATAAAAAAAAWKDIEAMRRADPTIEQRVANARMAGENSKLVPNVMGLLGQPETRAKAVDVIAKSGLDPAAQNYLLAKIDFMDKALSGLPRRPYGQQIDQYKDVFLPGAGGGFQAMRRAELRQLSQLWGAARYKEMPKWLDDAMGLQGLSGFDPQAEMNHVPGERPKRPAALGAS